LKHRAMEMKFRKIFNGKVAFVTGGASGMGRSLCIRLGNNGCRVAVADINASGAVETASIITENGGTALAMGLDVSDYCAMERALRQVIEEWSGIDYYINNAGIGISAEMQDISIEQWRKTIDVNLMGVINGTALAYGQMVRQGHGHIVNVASMAGLAPFPVNIPYTASKYGVVGLTSALQSEAVFHGINISLVCPGVVGTNFYTDLEVVNVDREKYTGGLPSNILDPDKAAYKIMKGIAARKKLILFPMHAVFVYHAYRLAPALFNPLMWFLVKKFRDLKKHRDN